LEYKPQTTNIDSEGNSIDHKVIRFIGQREKFDKTLKLFKKHKIEMNLKSLNKYNQPAFFKLIDNENENGRAWDNPFKKTDKRIGSVLLYGQSNKEDWEETHKNILSLLVAYPKEKLNSPDVFGNTISHFLAVIDSPSSKDHIEMIKLFQSRGGDLSIANKNGDTYLDLIETYRIDKEDLLTWVDLLKPISFTTANHEGITPLERLIFNNRIDLDRLMILKTDLDIDIKNKSQQTIMFSEKIMNEYSSKNKGCVLNLISQQNINQKDNTGNTALHHAVIRGFELSENTIKEFMKHGFDVNAKNNSGETVQELMKKYGGGKHLKLIELMKP
jgi:ankyrin repeat protein